jgi:hypothetical protein
VSRSDGYFRCSLGKVTRHDMLSCWGFLRPPAMDFSGSRASPRNDARVAMSGALTMLSDIGSRGSSPGRTSTLLGTRACPYDPEAAFRIDRPSADVLAYYHAQCRQGSLRTICAVVLVT